MTHEEQMLEYARKYQSNEQSDEQEYEYDEDDDMPDHRHDEENRRLYGSEQQESEQSLEL
jgi:hypothetical protein